jgi:hypothetical protein
MALPKSSNAPIPIASMAFKTTAEHPYLENGLSRKEFVCSKLVIIIVIKVVQKIEISKMFHLLCFILFYADSEFTPVYFFHSFCDTRHLLVVVDPDAKMLMLWCVNPFPFAKNPRFEKLLEQMAALPQTQSLKGFTFRVCSPPNQKKKHAATVKS